MTDALLEQQNLPFVSVVVPVYNDAARIQTCIAALLAQTYPRERYEVLIVDNGSTDDTRAAVAPFPVTLLVEANAQSSYAARNLGVQHARGDIIAFTDSDCTPQPGWLSAGVQALAAQHADLAGGNVRFVYSARPSGAEILDSLTNLKMERYIREKNVAATANLFARASLFEKLGLFPAVQSGGDMFWTGHATAQGYTLVYAPDAEVAHPTRRLRALLAKQFRVGKGKNAVRQEMRGAEAASIQLRHGSPRNAGVLQKVRANLGGLVPEPLSSVARALREHDMVVSSTMLLRVWFVKWLARATSTLGSLSAAGGRVARKVDRRAARAAK